MGYRYQRNHWCYASYPFAHNQKPSSRSVDHREMYDLSDPFTYIKSFEHAYILEDRDI